MMDDVVISGIWISIFSLLLLVAFLWAARPLIDSPATDDAQSRLQGPSADADHEMPEHPSIPLTWYYP